MNNVPTQRAGLAVRASDSEREQTVALLQRGFADGRLTQAELEERVGAAYAARTRAQLRDLTADLPDAEQRPPRSGMVLDLRLLIILLCVCPLAGLAYWLLSLRETALLRAWLMNAWPCCGCLRARSSPVRDGLSCADPGGGTRTPGSAGRR
jgi:Domain of unknown function (DUF1707)